MYIAAGLIWAPLVFAHEYIIGALAWERAGGGGASSVGIRRTLIRRLSRASRASRDAGLLITCLVLPMLPTSTSVYNAFSDVSFNSTTCFDKTAKSCMTDVSVPGNFARSDQAKLVDRSTEESWVIGVDDEEDAETCGANGCPWIRDIETPPRPPMLSIAFAILCAIAAFIVILSR